MDFYLLIRDVLGAEMYRNPAWYDYPGAVANIREAYHMMPITDKKELVDYDLPTRRCAYLYLYGTCFAGMVKDAMYRFFLVSPEVSRLWLTRAVTRNYMNICSLGGGPGTDLIGVLAAIMKAAPALPSYVEARIVDLCEGWRSTSADLVSRAFNMSGIIGSMSFLQSDLLKLSSSTISYQYIREADIVTMVKFFSAVKGNETACRSMLMNLMLAMKSQALLLYVDNAGGGFFQVIFNVAEQMNFIPVLLLPNIQYMEQFRILPIQLQFHSRFSVKPALQAKVSMAVWLKP